MSYPVILNGDHAEFEATHANTQPEDRPDWPLPSFDARDWAKAFCKNHPEADEGDMIGWFANALMRGYDHRAAEVARLRKPLKVFAKMAEVAAVARCCGNPRPFEILPDGRVAISYSHLADAADALSDGENSTGDGEASRR